MGDQLYTKNIFLDIFDVSRARRHVFGFIDRNFYLFFLVIAILSAFAYPHLGESSGPLRSDYTASYGATMLIFIISGMTLKTSELVQSVMSVAFNVTVQTESLVIIPLITWCIVLLLQMTPMSRALLDGLLIVGSLPTTVNMCVMLTAMANGDEPAALFNATFGNFIGIFVTPAWMVLLVTSNSSVSVVKVTIALLIKAYHDILRRVQECCLIAICYATFCNTFAQEISVSWLDLLALSVVIFILQLLYSAMAWFVGGFYCLSFSPRQRVAGLFIAPQKTVSLGLPLLAAMYAGQAEIGLYTIPLLIYHPMQMFVGSAFIPYTQKYIEEHETMLAESEGSVPSVDAMEHRYDPLQWCNPLQSQEPSEEEKGRDKRRHELEEANGEGEDILGAERL